MTIKSKQPRLAKPVAEALQFSAVTAGGVFDSALDNYDGSSAAQNDISQHIIQFRKSAKSMDKSERIRIKKRIATYSNSLAEK